MRLAPCAVASPKAPPEGAIAEHIARAALARIMGDSNLWPHLANTPALGTFWALPDVDRRRIWGDPINPTDAIADFDPNHIPEGGGS